MAAVRLLEGSGAAAEFEQSHTRSCGAMDLPMVPRNQQKKQVCHEKKKQVRFESARNGSVVRIKPNIVPAVNSEHSKKIWWNDCSLKNNRSENACDAQEQSQYEESILFLMNSYRTKSRCRRTLSAHIQRVTKADIRGLEQRNVPILKVMRKISSKSVLELQQKLRQREGIAQNPELVATLLRRKSLKMSRGSRQLAFRLAQADHMEAKGIYQRAA
jgi:hypothetical protein